MDIKQYRQKIGLTQAQLADAAKVSRVAIFRYESGKRIPPPPIAQRIAAVLGFDWTAFYQDKPAH